MRVVVTRPEPQATATAGRLATLGHLPILAPLVVFRPLPATIAGDYAGVVLTSQNAVRALDGLPERAALLSLPAFAVGGATAGAARAAGFARVDSADGDAGALAALLARRPDLAGQRLLHLCGRDRAGDLPGALRDARIAVDEAAIYAMDAVEVAPDALVAAAGPGAADALLVYSPRTARILARLVANDPRLAPLRDLPTVAISEAARAPLVAAGWTRARPAGRPDEEAVLAALAAAAGPG